MSLVEFIGFLISFLALIFLFLKKKWEERKRDQNPEAYQKERGEREEALKKFLKSMGRDMEEMEAKEELVEEVEEETLPPLPVVKKEIAQVITQKAPSSYRSVQDDYKFQAKMDSFKQRSAVEERNFRPSIENGRFQEFGSEVVSAELSSKSMQDAYKISDEKKISRIFSSASHLAHQRDLMIYYEILAKPKGLRLGPPWNEYDSR